MRPTLPKIDDIVQAISYKFDKPVINRLVKSIRYSKSTTLTTDFFFCKVNKQSFFFPAESFVGQLVFLWPNLVS